jgi:hypothetical protein
MIRQVENGSEAVDFSLMTVDRTARGDPVMATDRAQPNRPVFITLFSKTQINIYTISIKNETRK